MATAEEKDRPLVPQGLAVWGYIMLAFVAGVVKDPAVLLPCV